jgi:hypothetical protein
MTTSIKLTDTQRQVLEHAADHPDGLVTWFPDKVKGGARTKVIDGLFNKGLIRSVGLHDCLISDAGYVAVGRERGDPAPVAPSVEVAWTAPSPESAANVAPVEAALTHDQQTAKPKTRNNSKQATVIQMLQRPSGATINEICDATEWQSHTVRGFFAGALKKKLGLNITSLKDKGASRVYRVQS